MIWSNWARLVLVCVVGLLLQMAVLDQIQVFGAHPDVMVLLAAGAGLVSGPQRGAISGFVIGLFADFAVNTPYGLSGSIWTQNVGRALRVARAVQAGNLSVNSHASVRYWTPFGGFKQSGLGRELGPDALNAFTETKNVFIATD